MKIVVLSGGLSTERDVSITSGILVADALRKKKHQVILLDVFLGYEQDLNNIDELFESNYDFTQYSEVTKHIPNIEEIKALRQNSSPAFLGSNVIEICQKADITFLALHGDIGENGKLQACFDILGIKYTGTGSLGSALAMHKGITKHLLQINNIATPEGNIYRKADIQIPWHAFPCVVKPCSCGSSVGVSIADNKDQFLSAVSTAFKYEQEILAEQYIKGREFSVGVLDRRALPLIEIVPNEGFYDYEHKYQAGKTKEICPAHISSELAKKISDEALRVFDCLRLEVYARIDFLLDAQENFYCLEANTLPGMTELSLFPQEAAAIGITYEDLCDKIISISMYKY